MDSLKKHTKSYPDAGFEIFHIRALCLQQLSHDKPDYHTNIVQTISSIVYIKSTSLPSTTTTVLWPVLSQRRDLLEQPVNY